MDINPVPGMTLAPAMLRRGGVALVAATTLVAASLGLWAGVADDSTEVTLRVSEVAPGIVAGTPVQVAGFPVGAVREVRSMSGRVGVVLGLDNTRGLSDALGVEFASGNLFGVAEVVLRPREGGRALRNGALITPRSPASDNTISSVLALVGTVNSEAIRPNAGALLANVNRTATAVQPWLSTLGAIAAAVDQTERVTPGQTLQTWAKLAAEGRASIPPLLDAIAAIDGFAPGHDRAWADLLKASVDANATGPQSTIGAIRAIMTPEAARSLDRAAPLLTALANPVLSSLGPGAGQAGIDLEAILHAVYRAMPTDKRGPVLNVTIDGQVPRPGPTKGDR